MTLKEILLEILVSLKCQQMTLDALLDALAEQVERETKPTEYLGE